MSQPQKFTHDQLQHDLAEHLRSKSDCMAWENMQIGPAGSPRPDVYCIAKSFVRFCPITYEIKVSVSDFRSDITSGKWQSYLKFSGAVIFATPAGLITKADLPNGCGLIQRSDSGWRVAKAPTIQHIQTLERAHWLKLLMGGIQREADRQSFDYRSVDKYKLQESVRKKFGQKAANIVAEIIRGEETLQLLINGLEKQRDEISQIKSKELNFAIENAKRNESSFRREFPLLLESLGLSEQSKDWEVSHAIRNAAKTLSENEKIATLNKALAEIKRIVEIAEK